MDSPAALILLALACFTFVLFYKSLGRSGGINMPPGPSENYYKPLPLMHQVYHNLSKVYGPVFSLRRGRETFVVITGYQVRVNIGSIHAG